MKVFARNIKVCRLMALAVLLAVSVLRMMASTTSKDSLYLVGRHDTEALRNDEVLHDDGGAKTVRFKTNLIDDALLVPSIAFEFSYAEAWSVSASWKYAGWENDHRNRCWKGYGGDLELRRWLSPAKRDARLGAHVGVYVQSLNYDVEFGNRGYQSDGWHFGCGVSYGYALRLARRLHLDLTIGLGYLGGNYNEYLPGREVHRYIWQKNSKFRYAGPTKVEISFSWLIYQKKRKNTLGKKNTFGKKCALDSPDAKSVFDSPDAKEGGEP